MKEYLLVYFLIISAVTAIITVYDKWAAKNRPKHRVPEKTLFLFALFGGSVAEYLTMVFIRHKTKRKRFMLGLPAIIILQVAVIIMYMLYVN